MSTTEELRTQESLTRQISSLLGQINQQLQQQFTLNSLLSNQQAATQQTAAQVGEQARAAMQAAGISLSGATSAVNDLNTSVGTTPGLVANAGADIESFTQGVVGATQNAGRSWNNFLRTIDSQASGELFAQMNLAQTRVGGILGRYIDSADEQSNQMANTMLRTFVDVNQQMYTTADEYRTSGASLQTVFGSMANVLNAYNKIAADSVNMTALMRDGSEDLAIQMALFGKGLGYDAKTTALFVQRQISLTGEASTDMLQDAAASAKAIERTTGISSKAIGAQMAAMVNDTSNFGNVTVQEASRISATLLELGLDFEELQGTVGKFQAFDTAAQGVSALTTVFGVHLDAMEMMRMANEDQESMLIRVRESFLAAGRGADTLSLAEKRLIKEQLGFTDIESVERLLDPTRTITSMQDLHAATESIPEDMQVVLDSLSNDILDFGSMMEFTTERTQAYIREGVIRPFEETAIAAQQAGVQIGRSFFGGLGDRETGAIVELSRGIQDLSGMDPTRLGEIRREMAGVSTELTNIFQSGVGEANFEEMFGRLQTAMSSLDIGGRVADGIEGAVNTIESAFERMARNIIATLQEYGIIRDESPHTVIETAMEQNVEAVDQLGGDIVDMTEDQGISIRRIQRLNAEAARRAYTTSSEAASDAFTGATASLTEESEESFERIRLISNQTLTSQLSDATSVYSAMAREMGNLGLTYHTMSDEQKQYMRENLKLGEDWETQLQTIMNSEEAQRGRRQRSASEFISDTLESYRALGEDEKARLLQNEDFMTSLRENYNISEQDFADMISSDSEVDIGTTTARLLQERQDRRVAQAATRAGQQETSEESSNTVNRVTSTMEAGLIQIREQTIRNRQELTRIKDAIEEMSDKIVPSSIVLNIDGAVVADAVINNPMGTVDSDGNVTIQRS